MTKKPVKVTPRYSPEESEEQRLHWHKRCIAAEDALYEAQHLIKQLQARIEELEKAG